MKRVLGIISLVLIVGVAGCKGGIDANFDAITVVPETVNVAKGMTHQFQAFDSEGRDITDLVDWDVDGDEESGTVGNDAGNKGLYTAPDELPLANLITISASLSGSTGLAQASVNLTVSETFETVTTLTSIVGNDLLVMPGYQSLIVDDTHSIYLYVFAAGVFDDDPFVHPPPPIFDSVFVVGQVVSDDASSSLSKAISPDVTWTISPGLKTAADDGSNMAGMVMNPDGFLQMYHVVTEQRGGEVFQAQEFTSKELPLSASDVESGDIFSASPGTFLPLDEANYKWSNQPYIIYGPEGNLWHLGYSSDYDSPESRHISLWKNGAYFGEVAFVQSIGDARYGPYTPRMAFDSSGMGYIFYGATAGDSDDTSQLYIKTFDGSTFGSAVRITNSASGLYSVSSLVIDDDDNLWIASAHQDPDSSEVVLSVYKSTDAVNFIIEHQIDLGVWNFTGANMVTYPVVMHVDELGNTIMAYFTHDGESLDLQVVKNFGDPIQVNTESNTTYDLFRQGLVSSSISMDTDSAGRVYLTTFIDFDGTTVVMVQ